MMSRPKSVRFVLSVLSIAAAMSLMQVGGRPLEAASAKHNRNMGHGPTSGAEQKPTTVDPERSFSAQDDAAAIVPGFPDVRFFADSEQD